jgi:hypothetical protein
MFGREFQWFEAQLARADGGEEVNEELVTDGGKIVDENLTSAVRRVADDDE